MFPIGAAEYVLSNPLSGTETVERSASWIAKTRALPVDRAAALLV
jgi:hypothetical protein